MPIYTVRAGPKGAERCNHSGKEGGAALLSRLYPRERHSIWRSHELCSPGNLRYKQRPHGLSQTSQLTRKVLKKLYSLYSHRFSANDFSCR